MQSTAAIVVICSQYILAIPAGYIFAITMQQGIKGIWQGLILGNVAQFLLYYYVLGYRVRWEEKALEIRDKMSSQKLQKEKTTQLVSIHVNPEEDDDIFPRKRQEYGQYKVMPTDK